MLTKHVHLTQLLIAMTQMQTFILERQKSAMVWMTTVLVELTME
jgi:hypothetical protein